MYERYGGSSTCELKEKVRTSEWYLLFPSTSDGTCFSLDKKDKFTRFTVMLAS